MAKEDLIRTRIAPTPSGYLHIGNAYSFLLTEEIVHRANGSLRLRIDDLDTPRVRWEYVEDIFESLAWLGIQLGEGPRDAGKQATDYSQQSRLPAYNELLERLAGTGLVFACECSRKDLQQHSEDGQYTGTCMEKNIPLNTPGSAWRILTPPGSMIYFEDGIKGHQTLALRKTQRHFIIRRRDGLPAYQVASLCDDMSYGINTIVRGEDLLTSTGAQLYLAQVLGLESFRKTQFYHHPLLTDAAGEKLSKSAGSTSLRAVRELGVSGSSVRQGAEDWYKSFL